MPKQKKASTGRVVYIVDGARSPFLKMRGEPGPFSASDLGVEASKLLVRKYVNPDQFDQVVVGCAAPSEEEANIARVIALRLGCGHKVPAWTVQRNCASGLQAIDSAARSIMDERCDLVLAGGTEAMSRAPLMFNMSMVKWLAKFQNAKRLSQKLKVATQFRPQFLVPVIALIKGLTDPIVNLNMGQTAEELSYLFNITREEMDIFAARSHALAMEGQRMGMFSEITPLYSKEGVIFEQDNGVREDSTIEKLSKLKPVFEKHGNITAGNSSQISDGAAFVILASKDAVKKYDLPVLAKIVDCEWSALDPALMGLGPVHAITPILKRQNLGFDDIDQIEINEAFAAQVIACLRAWRSEEYCKNVLGLDSAMGEIEIEKLNPQGGAIAIGHPVGASGGRLVLHCAKMMQKQNLKRAIASLCIGGGQGGAILLERVNEVES